MFDINFYIAGMLIWWVLGPIFCVYMHTPTDMKFTFSVMKKRMLLSDIVISFMVGLIPIINTVSSFIILAAFIIYISFLAICAMSNIKVFKEKEESKDVNRLKEPW